MITSVCRYALLFLLVGSISSGFAQSYPIKGPYHLERQPGKASSGTVEIQGVSAGEFNPVYWNSGTLNLLPDQRRPLLEPRMGKYCNIYAPSVIPTSSGWKIFYGGWDGSEVPHDCIYSADTKDFLEFTNRQKVIDHGSFDHCCNVNALYISGLGYRLTTTVYPDKNGCNKPAIFGGLDTKIETGQGDPFPADASHIINIKGYDSYQTGDFNGMNVLLYEDGIYRLYFSDFKNFGKVYRASSTDGKNFKLDGVSLTVSACINDVKKLTAGGQTYYLMGLHQNGNILRYSLSQDGMNFTPSKVIAVNTGLDDRYMVAIGWVVRDNHVLGFLYGAGSKPTLDHNRIWARWLQKKTILVAEDGTRYEPKVSLGPDSQIIDIPKDKNFKGILSLYAEDSTTSIFQKLPVNLEPGGIYKISRR